MAESRQMGKAEVSDYERSDRRVFVRAGLFGFALFLTALVALPTAFNPLFRLFSIPATSMAPTLNVGDYVTVSRMSYGYSRYSFDWVSLPIEGRWPLRLPARGDIVIFRLPRDHGTFFVKRITGLPGDKVQMIHGRLWINGQAVPRDPAGTMKNPAGKGQIPAYIEHLPGNVSYKILQDETAAFGDDTPVFLVPPGHYFVLGDNRHHSADSRVSEAQNGVGYVPLEFIMGPVVPLF